MKTIKISLVVIVLAAIGAGVFFWIQSIKEPEIVQVAKNQFTQKIEQEIEQLKQKPNSKFCKGYYKKVALDINDFYKQNRFANNQSENNQWKENLESNLYAVYVDKFIQQAFYVFKDSDWNYKNLKFIKAEKNRLKKSKFLVKGGPVDKEFTKIQTILNKYYSIIQFINTCNNFSYSDNSLSSYYPIADVKSKIQRALSLQRNKLENKYVNNCTRLHNKLKEIPQLLFKKHVLYLDNKIDYWSNMWCNYTSHSDYSGNLNKPLKKEIHNLGYATCYTGVNIDSQYERLFKKWQTDNQNAYKATYPCE